MPKGQVNLTRQLKKLLGNAHADINNINLQKNTNILKIADCKIKLNTLEK